MISPCREEIPNSSARIKTRFVALDTCTHVLVVMIEELVERDELAVTPADVAGIILGLLQTE